MTHYQGAQLALQAFLDCQTVACCAQHNIPLAPQKHGLLGKAAFIAELRAWAKVSS